MAITWILREAHLPPESKVADIGAGTGILSSLLMRHGVWLYAVEPNAAMREAAESNLGGYAHYRSIDGTAEDTHLEDGSVDLITAAQAFHWFKQEETRQEFRRILNPNGRVALLWNTRRTEATPFLKDYEALLCEHGTDYLSVDHTRLEGDIFDDFFTHHQQKSFANHQDLDCEGLVGRVKSCSYVPKEGEEGYEEMLKATRELFEKHADHGKVTILYDTEVYIGAI
jgi:SAM-dependent methyltransferase